MKVNLNTLLSRSAGEVAPQLLGWILVRHTPEGVIKLKIVETEAYHQDDPASHSHKWKTTRTAPMFEAGGTIYVYFTYGMHYCLNIVTGKKGVGEAVLLRAAEPIEGIDLMRKNREVTDIKKLSNGPGKLTQALGIKDTLFSGQKLGLKTFTLEPPVRNILPKSTISSPRIGISQTKNVLWRFYIKDNPFVSRNK